MASVFTAIANSVAISAGTTVSVANVATGTNTFRFLNANATAVSYVGIFNTYTKANTAHHPTTSSSGRLIPLAPNESVTLVGDFHVPSTTPQIVYISAITATSGGQVVIATPIQVLG